PEAAVLPTCKELGIGLVPYSPLGKGFLTGKVDASTEFAPGDLRGAIPRFQGDARRANLALVDRLNEVAARKGATPAQIALAWLLAQDPSIVPIPGTTKRSRLAENIGAAQVALTASDLEGIGQAAAAIPIEGGRYPEALERMTGVEAPIAAA